MIRSSQCLIRRRGCGAVVNYFPGSDAVIVGGPLDGGCSIGLSFELDPSVEDCP